MRRHHHRQLTLIERRRRLKLALRAGGILIAVIGGMLLPLPLIHPEKETAFTVIRAFGPFVTWGTTCIAVGVVIFALSFLIRGDVEE